MDHEWSLTHHGSRHGPPPYHAQVRVSGATAGQTQQDDQLFFLVLGNRLVWRFGNGVIFGLEQVGDGQTHHGVHARKH